MKIKLTKIIPLQTRVATVVPETFNEDKRTVDVIFSTGARVKRGGVFSEPFFEELSLEKKAVNLERLNSGAPFLNNHQSFDLENQIGVVEKAKVDGTIGTATVRFSLRESVEPIFQDVKTGIIRNISVGYSVQKFEEIETKDGEPKVFRAVKWTPIELSAVPAGADNGAKIRSESEKYTCEVVELEKSEHTTRNDDDDPSQTKTLGSDPKLDGEKVVETKPKIIESHSRGDSNMKTEKELSLQKEAAQAEKTRAKEIRFAVRAAGLEDKVADQYIADDKTIDDVRSEVITHLAEKQGKKAPTASAALPTVEFGRDERDAFKEGVTEALLHRFRKQDEEIVTPRGLIKMPAHKLTDKGRPYMYRSLIDLCRMSLEKSNQRTEMLSKDNIFQRAFAIADFPEILANVLNKTLRDGYLLAPETWQPFTREVTVTDFKQISRTNLGEGESLDKVPENGEIKHGKMSENAEKYNVEDFAKIIPIGRKVILNDDLDAFTRVPEKLGRRAKDKESELIWNEITTNPDLSDGNPVFDAAHSNLMAAAAPTEAALSEGRKLMRLQVGLDGEVISLVPTWVYVSPTDETAMEKLLASIIPDSSSNVSPFSQSGRTPQRLAVEPRLEVLSGTQPWYMFADKGQVDMMEIARLEGQNGPEIATETGFETLGMKVRVLHTFGVKIIDFRGMTKNVGV